MFTRYAKATTKGQITIPSNWRSKFATHDFILEAHNDYLLVKPVFKDDIIFDSVKDNGGKGVSPQEIIDMINKIENE